MLVENDRFLIHGHFSSFCSLLVEKRWDLIGFLQFMVNIFLPPANGI